MVEEEAVGLVAIVQVATANCLKANSSNVNDEAIISTARIAISANVSLW